VSNPTGPRPPNQRAIADCTETAAEITGSEVVEPESTRISNQPYHTT